MGFMLRFNKIMLFTKEQKSKMSGSKWIQDDLANANFDHQRAQEDKTI